MTLVAIICDNQAYFDISCLSKVSHLTLLTLTLSSLEYFKQLHPLKRHCFHNGCRVHPVMCSVWSVCTSCSYETAHAHQTRVASRHSSQFPPRSPEIYASYQPDRRKMMYLQHLKMNKLLNHSIHIPYKQYFVMRTSSEAIFNGVYLNTCIVEFAFVPRHCPSRMTPRLGNRFPFVTQ